MKKTLIYLCFNLFLLGSSLPAYAGGGLPPGPNYNNLDFTDFVVFGGGHTILGRGVSADDNEPDDPDDPIIINGALVGSNGNIEVRGKSQTEAIVTNGDILLGNHVRVDGDVIVNGDVDLNLDAQVGGDIEAGGKVHLGRHSVVSGDVTAGGDIDLEKFSSIGGTASEFSTPLTYSPITLPPSTAFGIGTLDVTKGSGNTTTLLPGSYDDITLGASNVLNLQGGKYYMDNLNLGEFSTINIDLTSGEFEMYVLHDVTIGRYTNMFLTGGEADQVYIEVGRKWLSRGHSNLYGTVFSHGDLQIGRKTNWTGALYAGDVLRIRGGSNINFDLYCGFEGDLACEDVPPQTSAVPEPTTIALLASGLLAASRLKKLKKLA